MVIQNKRTGKNETVSIEQWDKMGEVQLQKFWNVLQRDDIDVNEDISISTFLNPEKKSPVVEIVEDEAEVEAPKPKKRVTNKK